MHYILRLGEITLKGKNRRHFEDKLIGNIRNVCKFKFEKGGGRLYIETEDDVDFRRIFGIVSYSPAFEVEKEFEKIKEKVLEVAARNPFDTFKISSQRVDKGFSMKTPELNRKLGDVVDGKVSLKNPDLDIGVEIGRKSAYVFTEKIACFGGLPVGIEGRVCLIVEDKSSVLAGLLVLKRGCDVYPVLKRNVDVSVLKFFGAKDPIEKIDDVKGIKAVVVNDTLKTFKEHDFSLSVLRPLIGLDENEIDKEMERYEGVCRKAGKES